MALTTVLVLFAAIYSCYMAVRYFYSPYKTETTYEHVVADTLRAKAVLIRDEQIIQSEHSGQTLGYVCEDGEVIIPGSVLAESYQSPAELRAQAVSQRYEREIQLLTQAQASSGTLQSGETLSSQINDTVGRLVQSSTTGDLSTLSQTRDALQSTLSRKHVLSGMGNFDDRIGYLKEQQQLAKNQIGDSQQVRSSVSGYFSSVTDGYEAFLTSKEIDTMPLKTITDAIAQTLPVKPVSAIGRAAQGHRWYTAVQLSEQDAALFAVGDKVILDFGVSDCREVPAVVYRVVQEEGSRQSALILQCSRLNTQLISMRHATVSLKSRSYSGLKVKASAVRYNGQQEGVYVIQGGSIMFKPIQILYRNESFVLCEQNAAAGMDKLRLFDEVIVTGTDIYDGKVVK